MTQPIDPRFQQSAVSEAFSRKAGMYDAFGQGHPILERMRAKIRAHILSRLRPGMRILELNAGTGSDAAYFARIGYEVLATDIAPGMLAELRRKAADPGLGGRLTVEERSFTELEAVQGAPYDLVFSNMGGLNCSADLPSVGRGINAVLTQAGQVCLVVMPPVCLWELTHGQFRRLLRGGTLANVEGIQFQTYYYSLSQLRQAMRPAFGLVSVHGVSVFTPTADHKEFPQRHPKIYRLLQILDDRLADWPVVKTCGDFYLAMFHRWT